VRPTAITYERVFVGSSDHAATKCARLVRCLVARRGVVLALAVSAALGPTAHAQSAAADSSEPGALSTTLLYTGAVVNNVAGGAQRGTVGLGAAAAQLTVRLRRLVGWHGAEFFLYVLGLHGGAPSGLVGDVQGVSTLEAPPAVRPEEAWLQQNMLGNRLSLLVGQYDLNTEFYFTRSGNLFLNGSPGMGAEFGLSGVEGPSSFPFTSVGARIDFKPSRNSVVRAAVLDGVPVDRPDGGVHLFAPGDGLLLVGEVALLSRPDTLARRQYRQFLIGRGLPRPYVGKVAIGSWYYTARFPDLVDTLANGEPVQRHGSPGAYVIADQTLWRAPRGGPGLLTAYIQVGLGDPRVNQIGSYGGGGFTLTAPFPKRAQDELGLAVAAARNGSHFVRAQSAGSLTAPNETALELTYFAQLAAWIAVQPDVQYVINPGGAGALSNALVLTLQLALSHSF
jgi:porin